MKSRICAASRVLLISAWCTATAFASDYTNAMYKRAMARDNLAVSGMLSVSPLYVLINVSEPGAQAKRELAILSTALTLAIIEEYQLVWPKSERRAFDIAMSRPNRTFQFKTKKARQEVEPIYTAAQLAEARALVRGKSRSQLRKEANVDLTKDPEEQSGLTKLYRRPRGIRLDVSDSYRVAVAHALLERGILVGDAHDTGALYVEDAK
jgi:hypothetical protein